jgi:hypothetical protein
MALQISANGQRCNCIKRDLRSCKQHVCGAESTQEPPKLVITAGNNEMQETIIEFRETNQYGFACVSQADLAFEKIYCTVCIVAGNQYDLHSACDFYDTMTSCNHRKGNSISNKILFTISVHVITIAMDLCTCHTT